jgi:hypothetical protein
VGRWSDRPAAVDDGPEPLGLGLGGVQLVGVARRPCRQGSLEDAPDRVRGLGLATLGVIQQLTAAAQQVRQAGLMGGGGEPAVGRPPIAFQHPGVVGAEYRLGVVEAAALGDAVDDHALAGERPQPRPVPRHPPAGLI